MKSFLVKAIIDKETSTDTGIDWALSKRTILKVNNNVINIAGYNIPFDKIIESKLRIVPSAYFLTGAILTVTTNEFTHHYGLSYSKTLLKTFPFVKEIEETKPPLLWLRRGFIIVLLGFLAIRLLYNSI